MTTRIVRGLVVAIALGQLLAVACASAQWGPNWQWGKVTISGGGAATFEMSDHTSGPLTYHEEPGGRRILTMKPLFGEWYVQATQVR
jgi:hypothetical protein